MCSELPVHTGSHNAWKPKAWGQRKMNVRNTFFDEKTSCNEWSNETKIDLYNCVSVHKILSKKFALKMLIE